MKELPPNDRTSALGAFLLGVWATVIVYVAFKWITDRLDRIERASRSSSAPQTIGRPYSVMDPDLDERLKEMRRESARDFARALREEGLTLTESDTDKEPGDSE